MAETTIIEVRNPRWTDYAHTKLVVDVNFSTVPEEFVEVSAAPDDPEQYGRDLYYAILNGDHGPVASFVIPPPFTSEQAMEELRARRNNLLADTDWVENPTRWARMTAEDQAAWTTYRNALRDLPANNPNATLAHNADYSDADLINVTWPERPDG